MSSPASPVSGRHILLGVSGSVAAYRMAELCSEITQMGADVHVVMTAAALRFVGAPTFAALSRNPVTSSVFDDPFPAEIAHIHLAQSADAALVAPATADVLARMAAGQADDMLSSALLALREDTPVLAAPAMNTQMWRHPATQENIATLARRGVRIIPPDSGLLACKDVGPGRLAAVPFIIQALEAALSQRRDYEGVNVLVTAGATREPLDPVRFLSNRSSGKMGYALASEARSRGGRVTLVTGFATADPPDGVELIRVATAEEMLAACLQHQAGQQLIVAAAAVADYAPETVSPCKIKKTGEDGLTLRLKQSPHILASLAQRKPSGQVIVGFAAETGDVVQQARSKPYLQLLDLVVGNDVTLPGSGFDSDMNVVKLIWPSDRQGTDDGVESLPPLLKRQVAERILTRVRPLLPL